MARDHVIVRGLFDFRTVNFCLGLFCFQVEILNRLSVALDASMVSYHSRFVWRRVCDIRRCNLLLAFLLEREN